VVEIVVGLTTTNAISAYQIPLMVRCTWYNFMS